MLHTEKSERDTMFGRDIRTKLNAQVDRSGIKKARNGSKQGRQLNANQRVPSRGYCGTGRIVLIQEI